MNVHEFKQVLYEYPSTSFIESLKKHKFKTLNEAIRLIHNAKPSEGKSGDKFKLKSFDGKNINLFQCWKEGCNSHILFQSCTYKKSETIMNVSFEIYEFKNLHNHKHVKEVLDFESRDQVEQSLKIDKFEYIRRHLCRYSISFYFRDYLNYFSSLKQPHYEADLPYLLPQFFSQKGIQVVVKTGFKCLNEKKKTYLFSIEVFCFGNVYTQVRYVTTLKSKNPEIYLYTLALIYVFLNNIKNCSISMDSQTLKIINEMKRDATKLLVEKKFSRENFFKFVMTLENDFFVDCTEKIDKKKYFLQGHMKKHYVEEENQRIYDNRKQISLNSENNFHELQNSTNEEKNKFNFSPFIKKTHIKLQELEPRELKSMQNKFMIAQCTYKDAAMSKNGQWHIFQEKPSVILKLNDFFRIEEVKRLKKEKNRQKLFSQDANFIQLSSDFSEDENISEKFHERKENKKAQQSQYLNKVLHYRYGQEIDIKQVEQKLKIKVSKEQEKLILMNEEAVEKVENISLSLKMLEQPKPGSISSSESQEAQNSKQAEIPDARKIDFQE